MFIALTGTIGSGKNTVADYLISQGFTFASGSEAIASEVKKRNLPVTRENMRITANELREQNGDALIDLTISKVLLSEKSLIGFLRTENEVKRLRKITPNATLVAIDAPAELRYKRIVKRNEEKDQVTFEQFMESESIEMSSSNPNTQNMGYCIDHSDFKILNDSTLEELFKKIDKIIESQ